MASNFECIGFDVENDDEFFELAKSVIDLENMLDAGNNNFYAVWMHSEDNEPGAELWVRILDEINFAGMIPYFRGKSHRIVRLDHAIETEDNSDIDRRYYAWSEFGTKGESDAGEFPFAFDAVNIYLETDPIPRKCEISLSAFANGPIDIFDNIEDFNSREKNEDTPFPTISPYGFIPTGLFEGGTPYAYFAGRVVETKELINPATGAPYIWALVETLGGQVDVLSAPPYVHRNLAAGNYILGEFWLVADLWAQDNPE